MNKSSILYSITFLFLFAGTSVILGFLWLIEYDQQNYTRELNTKYSLIANARLLYLGGVIGEKEFEQQTKNYNKMEQIDNPKEIRKILSLAEILARAETNNALIEIISLKREVYLNIIYDGKVHLYKDQDYQSYRYFIIKVIAVAVICILILLYIYIYKKLKPLKTLKKQIDKFAQGKLTDIQNVSTGEDEISQVSEAFYQAILQILKLNQSRQFFLRNIMHELKTPITKGLITLEMLENTKYKERLESIFNRLEILINEFAAIEQITSGATFINRKKYNILDILDEAKEIAMNDDSKIRIFLEESFFVNVDFKLFTTAFKNMIDNGMKYSQDGFVQIDIMNDFICFKNKGPELNNSLEYYTQAFTQGSKQKSSFGLGLYIVNTILEAHSMKLDYVYENGVNLFYFQYLQNVKE
ncbi:ArsS family sensor histidine kinase [Campylobacter sp. MIT 21-1685]|uniref:ArsS family sensor histidine kinase n=1 Tax=unclassified Campylobacter TaxID=2593542 RepID=UPI00224B0BF2|nr:MULTISPECIES: ArsS family sensor histidine kinase [unclassified Campylobacter]MCX2682476.1 ArsS family sensor histidine kinase [Campylobacter sp. MIT 21-1684]MCX2750811.1 ArsS family sensor histidine kinase [Campylobacter sp. MIT 21-1682]MCX2806957.1 ArsS family sensor histidine kinase [Campylobacter sp. MIT 21-1685]